MTEFGQTFPALSWNLNCCRELHKIPHQLGKVNRALMSLRCNLVTPMSDFRVSILFDTYLVQWARH